MESENHWRPPDIRPGDPRLQWFAVPGTDPPVHLQLNTERDAHKIMLAVAAAFNQFIEPLRDTDSASYTDGNSVYTSNHKNATAMDLNWDGHKFQVRGTFAPSQRATIAEIVQFCEGFIFWAGDWDDPVDEMHWQIGYDAWGDPAGMADFIARKIDANGFLTFRRGPVVMPPPAPAPVDTAAQVLYDAIPVIDEARAAELAPLIVPGLALAKCDNPRRIAQWLAQVGHESDGFRATEEYAKDGRYAPFIGRTWIQITWESNYAAFSKWAWGLGLVTNPSYFVDNPSELADDKWASIGPAWYWTVARPTINSLCDVEDIVGVTKLINGGTNGLYEAGGRQDRYNQAIALGDRLLALVAPAPTPIPPPPAPGGPLMALTDDEQQELLDKTREIWDQLRGPNGEGWPQLGKRPDGTALTPVDALATLTNPTKPAAKPKP